jgi:hypothetical protein
VAGGGGGLHKNRVVEDTSTIAADLSTTDAEHGFKRLRRMPWKGFILAEAGEVIAGSPVELEEMSAIECRSKHDSKYYSVHDVSVLKSLLSSDTHQILKKEN